MRAVNAMSPSLQAGQIRGGVDVGESVRVGEYGHGLCPMGLEDGLCALLPGQRGDFAEQSSWPQHGIALATVGQTWEHDLVAPRGCEFSDETPEQSGIEAGHVAK